MQKLERFRVLLVDAEARRRGAVAQALRAAGHEVTECSKAASALDYLANNGYDVVIADVQLPSASGPDLIAAIAARGVEVVIIMLTDARSAVVGIECLRAGAVDCVIRPFHTDDLLLRIGRAVERHALLEETRCHRQALEARLDQHSQDMRRLFLGAVESLASALEARDPHTRGHSARVADLAAAIALPLRLSEARREKLRIAGLLHDIGKIGIPDDVLKKPGRLTRRERALIQMHPLIAVSILSPVLADSETVTIIRHHHERIDGAGYPDRIAGDDIHVGARILAAADAYDAMTSKRPYRAAYTRERALEEMRDCAGRQLDTEVVSVFHMLLHTRANDRNRTSRPADAAGMADKLDAGSSDLPPAEFG
jgi:putative nucleotidyltransferase with HDIG domain